ncbi:MAG: hypothetical protein O7A67_06475 [SAR324 cluster bacterium]|nr:hypothetical protein [SAR324 cluster bacterium]
MIRLDPNAIFNPPGGNGLPLPIPREVWDGFLAPPAGGRAPSAAQRADLGRGWWAMGAALDGRMLGDRDPASGSPRPWLLTDREGRVHVTARWEAGGLSGADRRGKAELFWARLRLPGGGWIEIEPGTARHPLWGRCDRVVAAGTAETLARYAAVAYGKLVFLPALEDPSALPAGAAEALLNFLALLMSAQNCSAARYRGPYPTARLFEGLRRSFLPRGDLEQARERFQDGELALALAGEARENPVEWAPRPWTPLEPAEGVSIRYRDGIETVWIGDVPFRAVPEQNATLPAGGRVWKIPDRNPPEYGVGLVLLGEPHRVFLVLDDVGRILRDERPRESTVAPGPPLPADWRELIFAWCALRSTPPLAAAVLELGRESEVRWAALPLRLGAVQGDRFLVQSALAAQYRRLLPRADPGALALMLLSDVVSGLLPGVLSRAQSRLLETAGGRSAEALIAAGAAAHRRAQAVAERLTPPLLHALAEGRWLEALPAAE